MGDSVRDDLRSSLGDDYADLELRDLNPRELIRRQVEEALAERDEEDELDDETVEQIVDEVRIPATPDERKTA